MPTNSLHSRATIVVGLTTLLALASCSSGQSTEDAIAAALSSISSSPDFAPDTEPSSAPPTTETPPLDTSIAVPVTEAPNGSIEPGVSDGSDVATEIPRHFEAADYTGIVVEGSVPELSEDSEIWLKTFCIGVDHAEQYGHAQADGLGKQGTIDFMIGAFMDMADALTGTLDALDVLANPDFEGGEPSSDVMYNWLAEKESVYLDGANTLRLGIYNEPAELTRDIDGVTAQIKDADATYLDGMAQVGLDPIADQAFMTFAECSWYADRAAATS